MNTNLTQLINYREIYDVKSKNHFNYKFLSNVIKSHQYYCHSQSYFQETVNYLNVDLIENKYILVGHNNGKLTLNEISLCENGKLIYLNDVLFNSSINNCEWYPIDNGMFNVTSDKNVTLIDTNTFKKIENYKFSVNTYHSSWNFDNPSLLAVACSSSVVRIIDIRTGDSLEQITVYTSTGIPSEAVTRVTWAPFDCDLIIAGDSSGCLHIYDSRKLNKSLFVLETEFCTPINCITFTNDKMSMITSHGENNKIILWNFKNGKIVNSNVNFPTNRVKVFSKQNKRAVNLKCQLHVTDSQIYVPSIHRYSPFDILVYDLESGMKINQFSNDQYPVNTGGVNSIAGVNSYPLLFTGAKNRLGIWSLNIYTQSNNNLSKKYHCDNWSDSE